ncbi:MAG: tRNA (N6-threonylcarbamoyladenosine(37)-N6)-methyltransferase TrmO [Candidatus Hermodarchaeota archaeon]
MSRSDKHFKVYPIGSIKRKNESTFLEVLEEYTPALKQLDHFSHILVFWWADKVDNEELRNKLDCVPPYGENPPVTGVFATRAEYRPNPIALTVAKIIEVNHEKGTVKLENIDAFDGTPVLDIKAYFPVTDRVKEAKVPEWIIGWPEWFPEGGFGLE